MWIFRKGNSKETLPLAEQRRERNNGYCEATPLHGANKERGCDRYQYCFCDFSFAFVLVDFLSIYYKTFRGFSWTCSNSNWHFYSQSCYSDFVRTKSVTGSTTFVTGSFELQVQDIYASKNFIGSFKFSKRFARTDGRIAQIALNLILIKF